MLTYKSRLKRFLKKQNESTPEDLAGYFLEFYEPAVFKPDELIDGINALPRPYRELAAAHQAWGMISSDGFEGYVEENDERFDEEVRQGLLLLGHELCIEPLLEARKRLTQRWEELDARDDLIPGNPEHSEEIRKLARLPEEDDDRLFDAFYKPLAQFEDILGKYLIQVLASRKTMPKAIIFDFDGVIVDSEPLHYQAFVLVGKSLNFEMTWEQYLNQYIGFDDRDAFRYMLAQAIEAGHTPDVQDLDDTLADLIEKKQHAFEAIAQTGTAAIPGSIELIQAAHAAGLPIAIASGATHADIEQMTRLLGIRDQFDIIVAADDVPHSKPDPTTYALAFEKLAAKHPDAGLTPQTTLAIEDTGAGLQSAIGAGLQTLALQTTSPPSVLQKAGRVVENLSSVTLERLNEWYG